jgi:hypothetical protein
MKAKRTMLAGMLALAVSAMGGRVMAGDTGSCIQPGDPNYIPSLGPCKLMPTGPMGHRFTTDQIGEHNRVAQAINDPNYGIKLIHQWNDALRNGTTNLKDDLDMRVSWVSPRMAPDGTITVVIGVNTNGRPIPDGVFPATFLGHPVQAVANAPFAVVGTAIYKPLSVQKAGGTPSHWAGNRPYLARSE